MAKKVSEYRRQKFGYFFDFMDRNKDGFLTMKDSMDTVKQLRIELNLNQKGYLTLQRQSLSYWALYHDKAEQTEGKLARNDFIDLATNYHESEDVREEVKNYIRSYFHFLDQNDDGMISFQEYFAYYKANNWTDETRIRAIFNRIDTNNDGFVSKSEYVEAHMLFWFSDDPQNGFEFLHKYE